MYHGSINDEDEDSYPSLNFPSRQSTINVGVASTNDDTQDLVDLWRSKDSILLISCQLFHRSSRYSPVRSNRHYYVIPSLLQRPSWPIEGGEEHRASRLRLPQKTVSDQHLSGRSGVILTSSGMRTVAVLPLSGKPTALSLHLTSATSPIGSDSQASVQPYLCCYTKHCISDIFSGRIRAQ